MRSEFELYLCYKILKGHLPTVSFYIIFDNSRSHFVLQYIPSLHWEQNYCAERGSDFLCLLNCTWVELAPKGNYLDKAPLDICSQFKFLWFITDIWSRTGVNLLAPIISLRLLISLSSHHSLYFGLLRFVYIFLNILWPLSLRRFSMRLLFILVITSDNN